MKIVTLPVFFVVVDVLTEAPAISAGLDCRQVWELMTGKEPPYGHGA
ncbi:hypothetical protein [Komagataeibacter sp. FNDCR2]|nr:hypothetical protein [Komagataeibacter sp. FNDCR2]MCE2576529.1 hypothetical protein [Komagataeibacter sp. FNDCR2]